MCTSFIVQSTKTKIKNFTLSSSLSRARATMMVKAGCSNTSFRPQFVTELQHSDLDMLKLPSEFMMHVEDENKSRSFATVLSPIGKTWNIKLTRDHSETFLNEGWPEFSKFHKLEVGSKLVFRYEGNMVFNVKVFGLNGCLKDYNQDAVTILRRSGFNASRDKSPAKCASVTEASSSSGKQTKRKHDLVKEKERPRHDRSKMREDPRTTTNSYVKKIRNKTTISASHQTLKRRMNNCTIKFMTLPKIFGSVLPNNLEKGEITLKNEKQEIWKVQFSSTATKYNSFCGGWKQFCVKNNVKCGDTCTLEIIAHNEILVTISKAANETAETSDIKSDV